MPAHPPALGQHAAGAAGAPANHPIAPQQRPPTSQHVSDKKEEFSRMLGHVYSLQAAKQRERSRGWQQRDARSGGCGATHPGLQERPHPEWHAQRRGHTPWKRVVPAQTRAPQRIGPAAGRQARAGKSRQPPSARRGRVQEDHSGAGVRGSQAGSRAPASRVPIPLPAGGCFALHIRVGCAPRNARSQQQAPASKSRRAP